MVSIMVIKVIIRAAVIVVVVRPDPFILRLYFTGHNNATRNEDRISPHRRKDEKPQRMVNGYLGRNSSFIAD